MSRLAGAGDKPVVTGVGSTEAGRDGESAITTGVAAAALALLGAAVVLVPSQIPWLTIPMSM